MAVQTRIAQASKLPTTVNVKDIIVKTGVTLTSDDLITILIYLRRLFLDCKATNPCTKRDRANSASFSMAQQFP